MLFLLHIPFGFIGIRDHCPADRLCFLARALSSMLEIGRPVVVFHRCNNNAAFNAMYRDERIIGARFEKYLEKYLSTRKGISKDYWPSLLLSILENGISAISCVFDEIVYREIRKRIFFFFFINLCLQFILSCFKYKFYKYSFFLRLRYRLNRRIFYTYLS